MKLIDKEAVLAIIEKLKDEALEYGDKSRWFLVAALTRRIETLEVKGVDLDREIDKVWNIDYEDFGISADDFYRVTRYFFKLGLKAQKGEKI